MDKGNGTLMYQKTGQLDYLNNIFTAIPINEVNSDQFRNVTQGTPVQLTIRGNSCYTCWYFIKVRVDNASNVSYRLTISKTDENISGQFREIRVDNS